MIIPMSSIPKDAILTFCAEGNANVLYRIGPSTPEESDLSWDEPLPTEISPPSECLVRLRKETTTVSCAETYANFDRYIKPLFRQEDLLEQRLVRVNPTTIDRLNSELKRCDSRRLAKRRGVYLARDENGLLLEDMTSTQVIEFKPKWLSQSSTAPLKSKRCRTCARQALANWELQRKGDVPKPFFCPLDLFSSDPSRLLKVASRIVSPSSPLLPRFLEWLQQENVLHELREKQRDFGASDPPHINSCIAMTLRDCSLYLRFPSDPKAPLEAKLADLDVKPASKASYWISLDEQLISEGWYEGTEEDGKRQITDCALSLNA